MLYLDIDKYRKVNCNNTRPLHLQREVAYCSESWMIVRSYISKNHTDIPFNHLSV